jgi:hypothetical protein
VPADRVTVGLIRDRAVRTIRLKRRWQAYCFAYGMSDHAYDISHLLDLDTIEAEPAELCIVRTPPPRQAAPATPRQSGVAEAQEALARELMGAAAIHEALIHQYLSFATDSGQDSSH